MLLITVYAKNEKSDLSAADRKAIARIIGLIRQQLEQELIEQGMTARGLDFTMLSQSH